MAGIPEQNQFVDMKFFDGKVCVPGYNNYGLNGVIYGLFSCY